MKKLISVLVFIALTVCLLSAAESIAILLNSTGKITLTRNQKAVKFKKGEMLFNYDVIKSGGESFAAIKYLDGSGTIKVFPNSLIKLSAIKQGKLLDKTASITQGSIYSLVSSKIKGEYKVETPTTVASVKGTGYVVKYTDDNLTIIIVLDGEVLAQHKETGKNVVVKAGFTAVVTEDGTITIRATLPGDLSPAEVQQIEITNQEAPKVMKVQMRDERGNLKYIEITY